MARIVVSEPRGGLGDALLYSTLPELYSHVGHEVYVKSQPRNAEVAKLLYEDNPFVAGMTHEAPNAGAVHDAQFFASARLWNSPISLIEQLHFFTHVNKRPKVYYTPKSRPDFSRVVVADPRSISQPFPGHVFDRFAERLFDRSKIVVLTSPNAGFNGREALQGCTQYVAQDIYEYMDIVASCRAFLVTESGGHSLAAAIREDGIYSVCTTAHMNSRFFVYPGVNYTVVDGLSPTYLAVDPVATIL